MIMVGYGKLIYYITEEKSAWVDEHLQKVLYWAVWRTVVGAEDTDENLLVVGVLLYFGF